MNLPTWAKLAIAGVWAILKVVLAASGFPAVVISAIEVFFQHLGILPSASAPQSSKEIVDRALSIHKHCTGTCPSGLV